VDFFVEHNTSFSFVECEFKASLGGRMLEEIPLWIKMLFIKKGLLKMRLDSMHT
jgi:hypothetical protein